MMEVRHYITPMRITQDAIEGIAIGSNRPKPNELCTYRFLRRVVNFRCVYVCKLKGQKYICRFERVDWK